ncbi:NAD-dependent epimerase/dehydratase family protein [Vibrio sp. 10N.247.311.51]|uniref:NAD-dependent epimerase/dehydratase family protein n=1 Tax=Vibrio sp. 10N.247.311.51 TaxID=3229996 RepID=UPI003552858C
MLLVTGVTGFIGNHLSKNIKSARYVVLNRNECSFSDIYHVENINGNTSWQGAFHDIDVIVHLAGVAHIHSASSHYYKEVNTEGTIQLAREAVKAGVKRFVFVSSIGVNGTSTRELPFKDSSIPCPHNSYAQSKYDAELGLKEIAEKTGLEVVIVRPTLVYGPSAPGNFGMLTRLINKFPFLPFGLANNRRDFIAVQNLADLLVTCAKHPAAAGHTFLASDGNTVSIKEFTGAIAKGLGKRVFQLAIPVTLMRLAGKLVGKSDMIEQLYGNLEVDSSSIKDVLDWTPPLTMKQAMVTLRDTGTK